MLRGSPDPRSWPHDEFKSERQIGRYYDGMSEARPVVLIGPVSNDPAESVSAVNRNFIRGLSSHYKFVECTADRSHGATRQSRLTLWNFYYLFRQLALWLWQILRRPAIAHYAVSSGWALEKSLAFLWLANVFRIRTVGHLHSGGFIDYWKNLTGIRRRMAARVFGQIDAVVVLSEGWKRLIRDTLHLPDEKIFVVNNPIDQEFEDAALRWPLSRSRNTFLSLGVMGRDKGVLDVLQAVRLVSGRQTFSVQLAGPEREPQIREHVIQQIKAHSLEKVIRVRPSVWGGEKVSLFHDSSVFLLPSYYENFPLVLLEAAAAGHAIVTTPVGAIPEFFVDGESAIFVEPGNVRDLAAAMNRLLENDEERLRLAVGARDVFVRKLRRPQIMASLSEVYRSVLKMPSGHFRFPSQGKPRSLQSVLNGLD
jgi:glycosyltransferase involved in cell wall biosynthesis